MMIKYILALGSSHHQGPCYIREAIANIINNNDFSLQGESRIYKNGASATIYNSIFYNCAIAVTTSLHPRLFYRELFAIELRLGRIRTYRNARRTIDIDVLMSLDFTYKSSNFHLPHLEAINRSFFVLPAIEALKSAGWLIPIFVLKARAKFGCGSLCPIYSASQVI